MPGRLVLLPCVGQRSGVGSELELLPASETLAAVLEDDQGLRFHAALGGGAQLHWRHHAALAWQPNPLASRLAGSPVCSDAVLELPAAATDAEARQLVEDLAFKHLRGLDWSLSGAWGASASASQDARTDARRLRLQRHATLHARLLGQRRSLDSASSGSAPGSSPGSAPASPVRSVPPAAEAPATPPPRGAPAAPAAEAPRRREQGADGEDPRQQLLWQIAARATSMSWEAPCAPCAPSTTALAAPAPAGAAAAPAEPAAPAPAAAAAPTTVLPTMAAEARGPVPRPAAASVPAPEAPAAAPAAPALVPDVFGQPAKHRSSLEHWGAPWADLQPELLAVVLEQAGHGSTLARTLSQVCTGWRRGVGEERAVLQRLRFTRLELLPTPGGGGASGSRPGGGTASTNTRRAGAVLPWLVRQAVAAGNVAATVAAARWLERGEVNAHSSDPRTAAAAAMAAGTWYGGVSCEAAAAAVAAAASGAGGTSEAGRLWRSAAKLGHPEAQFKIGWASYKGLMGLPRDGEEAHLWLNRATKQLAELLGWALDGGSSSSGGGGGGAPSGRPLPALLSLAGCRRVLAQSAHILGYLCLDGEGTKTDAGAALRWFRLAQRAGCAEAGRMIGSLLNTGQYG